jgi:hypothetical protein
MFLQFWLEGCCAVLAASITMMDPLLEWQPDRQGPHCAFIPSSWCNPSRTAKTTARPANEPRITARYSQLSLVGP